MSDEHIHHEILPDGSEVRWVNIDDLTAVAAQAREVFKSYREAIDEAEKCLEGGDMGGFLENLAGLAHSANMTIQANLHVLEVRSQREIRRQVEGN